MMRPRQSHPAALGPAGHPAGPQAARPLRIAGPRPEDAPTGGAKDILEQLTRHILVAKGLGLDPLTIDERAAAMLDGACDGWRRDRRCREGDQVLDAPHQMCLRAQYHHDVLLLEHGLLNERASHER